MTMAKYATLNVAALAALTATGNGSQVDAGEYHGKARAILSHTAPGGTSPTWDFRVETSEDGSTWVTLASFAQVVTASGAAVQAIEVDMDRARKFLRLARTAGGTSPTVTAGLVLVGVKAKMP